MFVVAGESDSTSTMSRNTFAWAFEDESCKLNKNGTRLGGDIHNSATSQSKPIVIPAEAEFVFTAVYIESRFGQTRECALTGKFTPLQSHRYKAKVVSSDSVNQCSLGIYDITNGQDEQVDFSMPPRACMFMSPSTQNGRPLWTDYKVTVTTVPSK